MEWQHAREVTVPQDGRCPHDDTRRPGVVLGDADQRVRAALRALLETDDRCLVIGEADSARELVTCAERLRPALTILDLPLPHVEDGLAAIRTLAASATVVIVLTTLTAWREPSLAAGAAAFLDKGLDPDRLLGIVAAAARAGSAQASSSPCPFP